MMTAMITNNNYQGSLATNSVTIVMVVSIQIVGVLVVVVIVVVVIVVVVVVVFAIGTSGAAVALARGWGIRDRLSHYMPGLHIAKLLLGSNPQPSRADGTTYILKAPGTSCRGCI